MEVKKIKEFFSNKTNKNYFILVLIIVVYLFLLFIPSFKKLISKLSEVSQLKNKIVTTERMWANIDQLKNDVSQLNEKIDYYEKKLPGEEEIPAVLEYLSDSARKLNVKINEIKPLKGDKEKTSPQSLYYKVPILLKAECGYHQLGRFLSKLESADRFMKISNIEMTANQRQSDVHKVELIVVTYVMQK